MNTFGHNIRLTTFGESHGPALGGVLDGIPAGIRMDFDAIEAAIAERRPGSRPDVSQRRETDTPEWLSGIHPDGITLGTPIAWIVRNNDCRPDDYNEMRHIFRPGHADFTWQAKYGIRDYRGGGRASARETLSRVIGAAIAAQLPEMHGVSVKVWLSSVGNVSGSNEEIQEEILRIKSEGDSIGGTVTCRIDGLPVGVGEPVFGKLQSSLAHAMMTIPAVRCFEFGLGHESAGMRGSESIDFFIPADQKGHIATRTNFCGGIQGGISNGMPVDFKVYFHATPTIAHPLPTIDDKGKTTILKARGRHDPCVAVRGAAVVKAMAILAVADLLRNPSASVLAH